MPSEHELMVEALQSIVVSQLRRMGFKGSFPHFRRAGPSRIDLLTFQFDRHGGGFVIEISHCPVEGATTAWGEHIPPNMVRAWDMHPDQRLRLQPTSGSSTADWFRYDRKGVISAKPGLFEHLAESVLPYLDQAEQWWATR